MWLAFTPGAGRDGQDPGVRAAPRAVGRRRRGRPGRDVHDRLAQARPGPWRRRGAPVALRRGPQRDPERSPASAAALRSGRACGPVRVRRGDASPSPRRGRARRVAVPSGPRRRGAGGAHAHGVGRAGARCRRPSARVLTGRRLHRAIAALTRPEADHAARGLQGVGPDGTRVASDPQGGLTS